MTVTTEKLEASKKLARDDIDQVFNQHNPAMAPDFVTGDVVWHGGALGDITGAENLAVLLGSFIGALPDLRAAERDIIAENDLVVVRLVATSRRSWPRSVPSTRRGLPNISRQQPVGFPNSASGPAGVGMPDSAPPSHVRTLTWAAWRRPCWTRPCRRSGAGTQGCRGCLARNEVRRPRPRVM